MTPTPDEIRAIYAGIENHPGVTFNDYGWNSTTPIFDEVIGLLSPKVIVEAGVWNGASVLQMCKCCRRRGLNTTIYAVDVFHGPLTDHIGHLPPSQIPAPWTTPTRYHQFLYNIKKSSFDDMVIPVQQFTRWGAAMLRHWGVVADAIYIDAGHDEDFVWADLNDYWEILRPGGKLFGDDVAYPGVLAALGRFSKEKDVGIGFVGAQFFFNKP